MTTKQRILEFMEARSVSRSMFYTVTGIRRGLLDKNKLGQVVSDRHLLAINKAFPELSIEWLVTGEGSMFKASAPAVIPTDMVSLERYEAKVEECARLKMQLEAATAPPS